MPGFMVYSQMDLLHFHFFRFLLYRVIILCLVNFFSLNGLTRIPLIMTILRSVVLDGMKGLGISQL